MSCLAVPWHPPFSLHYQTARGLSACRPSSSSSFPPGSRPPADCLFLCSPTGGEAPLQETIERERFSMRTNLHLALEQGPLWNLRCPAVTLTSGNVYFFKNRVWNMVLRFPPLYNNICYIKLAGAGWRNVFWMPNGFILQCSRSPQQMAALSHEWEDRRPYINPCWGKSQNQTWDEC